MDNRIFNVNGAGLPLLIETLRLAYLQRGTKLADGWRFDEAKGFILFSYAEKLSKFPAPMPADLVAPMVFAWLETDEAKLVRLDNWDENANHDGHNSSGWRCYVEDWGHVGNEWGAICAITPAFMWHGK